MLEINNLLVKLKEQGKISKESWYVMLNDGIKFENIHFRGNEKVSSIERFRRYLKNIERS